MCFNLVLIYHETIYDSVVKKTPPPIASLMKGQGDNALDLRLSCLPLSSDWQFRRIDHNGSHKPVSDLFPQLLYISPVP